MALKEYSTQRNRLMPERGRTRTSSASRCRSAGGRVRRGPGTPRWRDRSGPRTVPQAWEPVSRAGPSGIRRREGDGEVRRQEQHQRCLRRVQHRQSDVPSAQVGEALRRDAGRDGSVVASAGGRSPGRLRVGSARGVAHHRLRSLVLVGSGSGSARGSGHARLPRASPVHVGTTSRGTPASTRRTAIAAVDGPLARGPRPTIHCGAGDRPPSSDRMMTMS